MKDLSQKALVIRADATTEIGAGHLMRCLALGQAWKDAGGRVCFITCCNSEALLRRLKAEGFDVRQLSESYPNSSDWESTRDILRVYPSSWVTLDGYHFDRSYHCKVKESGHSLLVIDDLAHLRHYQADIILNQNLNAKELAYSCEPNTLLLLGTRFVLLRREFLCWVDWKRQIHDTARHILVSLGGSDPQNYTLKVIDGLQKLEVPDLQITVVVGASNPHMELLQAAVKDTCIPIRLLRNAENMPELMALADVAVSAAGTTSWELMFMGVPSILVVAAPNQTQTARHLKNWAVAVLEAPEDLNSDVLLRSLKGWMKEAAHRLHASEIGRSYVDGLGASRILDQMVAWDKSRAQCTGAESQC